MKDVGSPVKMSGAEQPRYVYPPALGEHTDEVLRTLLDFSPEKIAALRSAKVI
jgi:crotonobetainyl-CoA:carnitine CoA-transferase CaiB-like acyl-CoA transferase